MITFNSDRFSTVEISKSNKHPNKYWDDIENQRKHFELIGKQFNIQKLDDWYGVERKAVATVESSILSKYKGSLINALLNIYPEHNWQPWRFSIVPKGFWDSIENQRKFLEYVADNLKITKLEDWYKVRTSQVLQLGGRQFLSKNGNSLYKAIANFYKEYNWKPWCFRAVVPDNYWNDIKNQRELFDWLADQLKIKTQEDWYKVKLSDLHSLGAAPVLKTFYKNSVFKALSAIYPQYTWDPYKFRQVSYGFWSQLTNQREFVEKIGKELKIETFDDWYKVKGDDFIEKGGAKLLIHYGNSLYKMLVSVFPEHSWIPWRFSKVPQGYWKDINNQRNFFESIAKTFNVQSPLEWSNIRSIDIYSKGASGLFHQYGGFMKTLTSLYADQKWNFTRWSKTKLGSKGQLYLETTLRKIIPAQYDMLSNYCLVPGKIPEYECDIFIPALKLALEYQGQQHFSDSIWGKLKNQQEIDMAKRQKCKELNLTLIEIPYWWDGSVSSLKSTIHRIRPDLFEESANLTPIPESPPRLSNAKPIFDFPEFQQSWLSFSDYRKHAIRRQRFFEFDSTSWWISKRVGGLRAIWDSKQLFLREGSHKVPLPPYIATSFPKFPLEGEIRFGQLSAQEIQDAIYREPATATVWKEFCFNVYDTPHPDAPFETRMANLKNYMSGSASQFVKAVDFELSRGINHVNTLASECGFDDEIVLYKPKSKHLDNQSVIQIKSHSQEVVVVTEFLKDSLLAKCTLPNAKQFQLVVPSVNIGAVIDIRFSRVFKNGVPLDPKFYRIVKGGISSEASLVNQVEKQSYFFSNGYFISYAPPGSFPNCRGCNKKLLNKDDPRIQMRVNFYYRGFTFPAFVKASCCVTEKCFNKTIEYYSKKKMLANEFEGFITVDKRIPEHSLPLIENVKYVSQIYV